MWATLPAVVGLGIDLVHIPRIEESLRAFGDAFATRLFTEREQADARAVPGREAEGFALRFAVKEATIKALSLSDDGVNWREMEVVAGTGGACRLVLHGVARDKARELGVARALVCWSHEGAYAMATVAAVSDTVGSGR
ncbi:4'-phosphopantetheinyl transferase superfamily protein [Ramlibacter sp. MAH-25]|uniref:Holo-[acyl-carrier-protein] synthase n=2 Tax=Comamonadaceae TaxID=80864 RepID=A0A6N8J1V1_9BURK|nr:4'-phosphopantetheinyl transferase superfamily protein [Ramlibacter pinisoli]